MEDKCRKERLMAILPSVLQPPPDHTEDINHIISLLTAMVSLPPALDTSIRHRLFGEDNNVYQTRNVFLDFSQQ